MPRLRCGAPPGLKCRAACPVAVRHLCRPHYALAARALAEARRRDDAIQAHTRCARESQRRALELSAPTSTVTRTLLNIDAAACSHHNGDTEQARRRTVTALTALPGDYRTGLVRRRALDLYEAIPAQHHRERAVRALRDVMAS
ncbi:hypothetical protein M2271_008517 [Streptomyces sp. LBL]|uniref:hypothetical protein n=1 Tax=Streptomyces sp. LBL TaxID=2940562 RepID=UPI002475DD10|nr:hypothetical protein [Streptomyces sp. LBL]MDH6630656.1 hypothetical protein [Streptomyces sp. LBL]